MGFLVLCVLLAALRGVVGGCFGFRWERVAVACDFGSPSACLCVVPRWHAGFWSCPAASGFSVCSGACPLWVPSGLSAGLVSRLVSSRWRSLRRTLFSSACGPSSSGLPVSGAVPPPVSAWGLSALVLPRWPPVFPAALVSVRFLLGVDCGGCHLLWHSSPSSSLRCWPRFLGSRVVSCGASVFGSLLASVFRLVVVCLLCSSGEGYSMVFVLGALALLRLGSSASLPVVLGFGLWLLASCALVCISFVTILLIMVMVMVMSGLLIV